MSSTKYIGKQSATLRSGAGSKTLLQSLPLGIDELLRKTFLKVSAAREAFEATSRKGGKQMDTSLIPAVRKSFTLPNPNALSIMRHDVTIVGEKGHFKQQEQENPAAIKEHQLIQTHKKELSSELAATAVEEEQKKFVELLAKELELGHGALTKWRDAYHNKHNWEKKADSKRISCESLARRLVKIASKTNNLVGSGAKMGKEGDANTLVTSSKDAKLLEDAVMIGNCVIAPFVALSEVPRTETVLAERQQTEHGSPSSSSGRNGEGDHAPKSSNGLEGTTTFIATRNIPAGVFLMSIPTEEAVNAADGSAAISVLESYHEMLEKQGLLYVDDDPRASTTPAPISPIAKLTSNDMKSGDAFFIGIEEIAMRLAMGMYPESAKINETDSGKSDTFSNADDGSDDNTTFFSSYVSYLLETVRPPRNLPYLAEEELVRRAKGNDESTAIEAIVPNSSAVALWRYFHLQRKQQPLNLSAFRQLLLGESHEQQLKMFYIRKGERERHVAHPEGTPNVLELSEALPPLPPSAVAEYHWLLSVALSRRLGSSLLVPLLDKLNHCCEAEGGEANSTNATDEAAHATADTGVEGTEEAAPSKEEELSVEDRRRTPNAYYTMATVESFCGLDLFDNLIGGVSADRLYVPHVHLFALRSIRAGESVTISYSDIDPKNSQGEDLRSDGAQSNDRQTASKYDDDDDGAALWKAFWGFVPADTPLLSESDLVAMASIVSERRLLRRAHMFPKGK